jgi:AraC family transcriptional regulator
MLTNRVLWVIERNLSRSLTLSDIADTCGVSQYHLAHAFGAATGLSVMQYVRSRRLSAAAQALADGAPDILGLALDTGYGSHEAFSRAFRVLFGATPEMVRQKASTEGLPMVTAIKLPETNDVKLEPPRIVSGGALMVVGLAERRSFETAKDIAGQWQRFMAGYAEIPDRTQSIPVGIVTNMDDDGNFEYMCAAEVTKFSKTPRGLVELRIPAQNYAVFTHREHVSTIAATYSAILNNWLPASDCRVVDGAVIERHLETFDPRTGFGGVEIWMPIQGRK